MRTGTFPLAKYWNVLVRVTPADTSSVTVSGPAATYVKLVTAALGAVRVATRALAS